MKTNTFIQALPKAELHLHLEGAVPWGMVQAQVKSCPFPPPWWANDYRFDDFNHFAKIIGECYDNTLTGVENYFLAAQGVYKNLMAQNVRYVEISFSLGHALAQKLPLDEIIDALKRAAPTDLIVRVFCGISRSRPQLLKDKTIDLVLDLPKLDGLDLHGDETMQGPARFALLFTQARQQGLATKAHAGELAGPHSMQEIIDTLQLTRIEHGVTAIEDEDLMSRRPLPWICVPRPILSCVLSKIWPLIQSVNFTGGEFESPSIRVILPSWASDHPAVSSHSPVRPSD